MPGLFFRFAWHANHRQFPGVPIQITRQTLTQSGGIAWISLYPGILLVEFARGNDVAARPSRLQLPKQTKPKAARFIDNMHRVTRREELLHPRDKLRGSQ